MYGQQYNLRTAKREDWKTPISLLATLLTVSACAGGGIDGGADSRSNRLTPDRLAVCRTYPNESTPRAQVKVDDFIYLTFSQKVDDLSFFPENFELWDEDFNRIPFTTALMNSDIRLNDDGTCDVVGGAGVPTTAQTFTSNEEIIRTHTLRIRPSALQSFQNLVAIWRNAATARRAADPVPGVIASATGAELEGDSVKIGVGDQYSGFNSIRIKSTIRPGLCFDRISNINQSFSLSYLFNGSGLVTLNRRANISIEFQEPVYQVTHDVDPEAKRREMAPTDLRNYPGLVVYALDANTDWNSLYDALSRLDQNSWFTYLQGQRLNGSVKSTNGRRNYVFELEAGRNYPDGAAKIIIAAYRGFRGINNNKPTDKDLSVCGFFHSSGFTLPTGFPSIQQALGLGGGL